MANPTDSELTQRARRLTMGRNTPKAGRALGEMGREAIPTLHVALAHANPFVRSGALHGFAAVVPSGPDVVAVLATALGNDPDPRVRETACFMLAQLGPAAVGQARDPLEHARAHDPDERVRAAASAACAPTV